MFRIPVILVLGVICISHQTLGFWFLKPLFTFNPLGSLATTTTTTTTTTAAPTTATTAAPTTVAAVTTPTPVQVSAGFVSQQIYNQSGAYLYPQYGFAGVNGQIYRPGQYPGAIYGQGQYPGAIYGQGQYPGATYGQGQYPGAIYGQGQLPQSAIYGPGQLSQGGIYGQPQFVGKPVGINYPASANIGVVAGPGGVPFGGIRPGSKTLFGTIFGGLASPTGK